MASSGCDQIDLQDAADRLGVHYQTAYRWVRSGRLSAVRVGGRYRIALDALERLQEERLTPSTPRMPSPARLQRQAQLAHHALLTGDEATVREIARGLVSDGTPLIELVQTVLVPPLRWIGQAWKNGELPIFAEHQASAIVEGVLGDLSPNPRGRRRGVAVVAAVSGDRHSLPTKMATVALRDANWQVHLLGADLPGDELVRFCAEREVNVAVISLTNTDATDLATATADRLRRSGTPVVVGGPGRSLDDLVTAARKAAAERR